MYPDAPPDRWNRLSEPLWSSNSLLLGRSRRHVVKDFPGPLSIKTVVRGVVDWQFAGRTLRVGSGSFLILNEDEPYSMDIDSPEPVETCCVFFKRGFVESVFAGASRESIEPGESRAVGFGRDLRICDSEILARMAAIRFAAGLQRDEEFLGLAHAILAVSQETQRELSRMPARRASTREELYRRVCRGREYLHAFATQSVGLDAVARAACLSPFHFQRAFKDAFGRSPHAYLTELRLRHAHSLLAEGRSTVGDAAYACGFESSTSFAALFRRRFGKTPSAVRRLQVRKIQ